MMLYMPVGHYYTSPRVKVSTSDSIKHILQLLGKYLLREHSTGYSSNLIFVVANIGLKWANFWFANLFRSICRTATKLFSGSKKLRLICSGTNYSPNSANVASDWLRAKRALLWMTKK